MTQCQFSEATLGADGFGMDADSYRLAVFGNQRAHAKGGQCIGAHQAVEIPNVSFVFFLFMFKMSLLCQGKTHCANLASLLPLVPHSSF